MYPQQAPAPRGNPAIKWVALGCASLALVSVVAMCGGLMYLGSGAEGGTRFSNTMEPYAVEYLAANPILLDGEQIVAYYDTTISLDGTEAAILTDRRLVYHNRGTNSAILLTEIEEVRHEEVALIGDMIDVRGTDGSVIHIEVAPLNNGAGFLRMLEEQRAAARIQPQTELDK